MIVRVALAVLYWLVCAACLLAAMRAGGRWEVRAASILLGGSLVTTALVSQTPIVERYIGFELGVFVIDVAVLGGFVWLALQARRIWPIWAAGFMLVSVAVHLTRLLDPAILPRAYATAEILWSYLMWTAIALGTRNYARWSRWRQ
jgi:hypothetical protein